MPIPNAPLADWRDPSAYTRLDNLEPAAWAWQFLRRNPAYRSDYRWFIARWHALESAYGKAPNRDMDAWKRDPRAYAPSDDKADEAIGCVAENGRPLVECWLGAKWGFYKFPVAPEVVTPAIPDTLLWREPADYAPAVIGPADGHQLAEPAHLCLQFDLEQPLKAQLEAAKRILALARRELASEGAERRKRLEQAWRYALRLLDARDSGVSSHDCAAALGIEPEQAARALAEGERLRTDGYLLLARRSWVG